MLSRTSKIFDTKTLTTSGVDTKTRTIHSSPAIPLSLKELGNIIEYLITLTHTPAHSLPRFRKLLLCFRPTA